MQDHIRIRINGDAKGFAFFQHLVGKMADKYGVNKKHKLCFLFVVNAFLQKLVDQMAISSILSPVIEASVKLSKGKATICFIDCFKGPEIFHYFDNLPQNKYKRMRLIKKLNRNIQGHKVHPMLTVNLINSMVNSLEYKEEGRVRKVFLHYDFNSVSDGQIYVA